MCGIAGLCNYKENPEDNIKKMNARMKHRGPDADGIWCNHDKSVVLGHQRLSIVDLSPNGAQPMMSHSGRYQIAFNGEIYNYKVLRQKLIQEGVVTEFRGHSDTEVLVEAMEHYGIKETISFCKGMFAIALYDTKEETLYLLRDRVGEKPLYYGFVGKAFAFASEIGCIAALDGFSNPICTDILDLYFLNGYIPAPYSIYRDIYKLEPGTILTLKAPFTSPTTEVFWSMREAAKQGQEHLFQGSRQEASEELERLLKGAIQDQMVADVPVGAFLSAGIDSTTVVALMQSLSSHQKVKSFTIGMHEEGYNEAVVAKEIANLLGTEHTELYITEEDAKKVIPTLSYLYGEPFADSSQIPTALVSKMTKQHVTVSLSGDGGDELFCGYGTYDSICELWNRLKKVPYPIRKLCSELVIKAPFITGRKNTTRALLLGANGPEQLYEVSNQQEPLALDISKNTVQPIYKHNQYKPGFLKEDNHKIMLMDLQMYHPDDILVKVDRAGMAVSLETRVPMLDKDVVEFAWSLPIEYKKKDGIGKLVLRDILYRYVPKEIMDRPKKGFGIPIDKWLKEPELREWAEMLIERKTLEQQGILNPDMVWRIWNDFIQHNIWRVQIWYILMFQEWMFKK